MVNETHWTTLLQITRKVHKSNKNIEFLSQCQNSRILPKFTFFKNIQLYRPNGNMKKFLQPCSVFNSELANNCGDTLLKSGLLYYKVTLNTRDRKTYEAIAITIQKPILNAQVSHRKVSII